jgi:hypothetical protein
MLPSIRRSGTDAPYRRALAERHALPRRGPGRLRTGNIVNTRSDTSLTALGGRGATRPPHAVVATGRGMATFLASRLEILSIRLIEHLSSRIICWSI